ncbi:MAG: hypothetical protein WA131_12440 [Desulfitobacteriaceae bacterium]
MTDISKIDLLRTFILSNLDKLQSQGGGGQYPELPNYELGARDYLQFAEKELDENTPASLINCVAHLKRALDCQLDTFLYVYKLDRPFRQRNLKIDKKLNFLKESGVFGSRSLSRFNSIRNRMEHTYEIPKIQDLDVYFDLVAAFIAMLERTIVFTLNSSLEYYVYESNEDIQNPESDKIGFFGIDYVLENEPQICVSWNMGQGDEKLSVDLNQYNEFAFFFKVFLLLCQRDVFVTKHYIESQLA